MMRNYEEGGLRLHAVYVYPLKSGAGVPVGTVRLEAEGLAGDRRMMVVDEAGVCLTARTLPHLLTVRTHLDAGEVVLTAPGMPPVVFRRDDLARTHDVSIWGDDVVALDAGDAVADWLSAFLGVRCRLAVKGKETLRPLAFDPQTTVSFADTAPLLLTSTASLRDLNRFLDADIEMERFRPNLVIEGAAAYDEDGWEAVRVGEVVFDVAGACDRCVMVTLDPRTGEKRSDHEPLAMLGRQRRGEDGKPYFGQFLIPRTLGRLHAGDAVEILGRKQPIAILPGTARPAARLPLVAASTGPGARGRQRRLKCVGITEEADDFRTFRFAVEGGDAVAYKPGQFITLLLDIAGEQVRRNYTISSSPSRPHGLSVTVKRVSDGRVSAWLHDNLKVGDAIGALGPNGRFHLAAAQEDAPLLLLSAGSGITPMMAMLRFIADTSLPRDVHFHHSARTARDVAFLHELLAIKAQLGPRLRLSWNLTGPDAQEDARALQDRVGTATASVIAGRLDAGMLRILCPDLGERVVFCCGPNGFRSGARAIYEGWVPAPRHAFLEETFGAERTGEVPDIGPYAVEFLNSGQTVCGSGAVTVLELARKAGIALPADCEAGICGTCRCKVVSGEWRVAANAADPERAVLSDQEKAEGYVLACSTNPVGTVRIAL